MQQRMQAQGMMLGEGIGMKKMESVSSDNVVNSAKPTNTLRTEIIKKQKTRIRDRDFFAVPQQTFDYIHGSYLFGCSTTYLMKKDYKLHWLLPILTRIYIIGFTSPITTLPRSGYVGSHQFHFVFVASPKYFSPICTPFLSSKCLQSAI